MPIACPVCELITAEPELPTVVSTWYWMTVPAPAVNGPVLVCCVLVHSGGVSSIP